MEVSKKQKYCEKTNAEQEIPQNTKNPLQVFFDWLKQQYATNLLLAIFTLIIAFAAISQCYFIKKSDESTRLRDRAYLYFLGADNRAYPNEENAIGYRNDIFLENAGNMPARRVFVRHGWKEIKRTENITNPWGVIEWEKAQLASVVGPRQHIVFQGKGIPTVIMESVKKLEFDIILAMEATYLDGFSKTPRITQMCRILRYDKAGGHSLSFADTNNCSDGECPK